MAYAENTEVSASRSQNEIEALLDTHGATMFLVAKDKESDRIIVQFKLQDRFCRFEIRLPGPDDPQVTHSHGGRRRRSAESRERVMKQAERQRWRALLLVIKAKLESVESGVETFEEAFLAHVMLPDGQLVGQKMQPLLAEAYETGRAPNMTLLLPAPDGR